MSGPWEQYQSTTPAQGPWMNYAAPKPKIDVSAGRTALDQSMQGATFGFADEVMDRIGAGIASLATDENYNDLLQEARNNSRERMAQQMEQRPVLSIASNLAGGLLTGGAAASTKAGGAVGNMLRTGGKGARIAKGVATGASTGALYGAGSGEDGNRIESAKQGAIAGGIVGGAIPAAGAALGSLKKPSPKTSTMLREEAAPLFKKFASSGATYSPKLTEEIADIADSVRATGIAGATKKADNALNEALDFYSSLRGKALSPADIQKLDQSFADDIARFNKSGEYNFGRILNNLKYEFRNRAFKPENASNYVQGGSADAVENLVQGNRLWSQSYKARDIEKILQKAQGTDNPQTSIRNGIKNLLANDKKMASYSDEERALLEQAMKRGFAGGAMKLLGSRLIDAIAGAAAGGSAAGPAGAIAGAVAGKSIGGGMSTVGGAVQANRALRALERMQGSGSSANSLLPVASAPAGAVAGSSVGGGGNPTPMAPMVGSSVPAQSPAAVPQAAPNLSPRSDLMERVIQTESGGNQSAVSPKGAVGVAQVMPETAPEAAKMAGLAFDPVRYRTDASYNAALGEAYLNNMMNKYNQNLALALMAYNWGPGNTDRWLSRGADESQIPQETRNYIAKILRG